MPNPLAMAPTVPTIINATSMESANEKSLRSGTVWVFSSPSTLELFSASASPFDVVAILPSSRSQSNLQLFQTEHMELNIASAEHNQLLKLATYKSKPDKLDQWPIVKMVIHEEV